MMDSKITVTKANELIKASYKLSVIETQIIIYGISLINPVHSEFPREYTIEVRDFAKAFGKSLNNAYRDLKKAILGKFWERDIRYFDDIKNLHVRERWLTKVSYSDGKGILKIKFSEEVQPFLYQLFKNFTVYYLEQVTKLRSVYSIRFYELCVMEINRSKKVILLYMIRRIRMA